MCLSVNMEKFIRASILPKICEQLFERFPTGTNTVVTSHIGSE